MKSKVNLELSGASLILFIILFIQMRFYFLDWLPYPRSDLAGFFARYSDGNVVSPYESSHITSFGNKLNPVEYPVGTGLIIWLTALSLPGTLLTQVNYFALNAAMLSSLFVVLIHFLKSFYTLRFARLILYSPPIITAVFLNWDLWTILPMILAIAYFETNARISALLLGISIGFKFFPIVILIPILIIYLRSKEYAKTANYLVFVFIPWLLMNIYWILKEFDGWSYFYKFSFTRSLGDASIYDTASKLMNLNEIPTIWYLALNSVLFISASFWTIKKGKSLPLEMTSFLFVSIFVLGGKVYSMQYILWTAPLAAIAIAKSIKTAQPRLIKTFLIWQFSEFLIQYGYFGLSSRQVIETSPQTTPTQFALFALIRYIIFIFFILQMMQSQKVAKKLSRSKAS